MTASPPADESADDDVEFVTTRDALERVAARCEGASRVAVDVEANGLFVYRQRLCTVQLAWDEDGATRIAIVDTLATPVTPLTRLLGEHGPEKVLHDLTFDAKMLADAGAPLVHARDTSVAARMLGRKATGLATLLAEVGLRIDKRFQQHDWAQRPLARVHLVYLAGDVRHLLALDDRLRVEAEARDIQDEIDEECAYKLASALKPPRDPRPAYVRIKGASMLDAEGRAILRRLVLAREAFAEREDVPPFKVVGNEVLIELAQKRPRGIDAVRAIRGATAGRAGKGLGAWNEAVARGIADGDVPEADRIHFTPSRPDRAEVVRRRAREAQLATWRRTEAVRRGVDEQAVLPGHCAQALVDLLLASRVDASIRDAIAAIPGFGARRVERYGDELAALAAIDPEAARASNRDAAERADDGSAHDP